MGDYIKSGIVMLNRSQLHTHPDNPRKDLGDLTELKESIREHGIMQNLTVVPIPCKENQYVILIGHRRFAASEGIVDELPCVIAEGLTAREQVGIMLCENMQRADLTYMEQAHGFQLMLDLGETVQTISEKTGFSEATVKHRLEINKIDPESLEKAKEYFQPTISDFIELERVKDLKERNEILENAESSKDIQYEVQSYIERKNRKENTTKYLELIKSFGWKESKEYFYTYGSDPKWKKIDGLSSIPLDEDYDDSALKALAARTTTQVYYRNDGWNISLAIKNPNKKPEQKHKSKEELLKEARDKQAAELNDIRIEICDSYYKFITEMDKQSIKVIPEATKISLIHELIDILFKVRGEFSIIINSYNIKTKHDIKSLSKDFEDYSLIQKLFLLIWAQLTLSYTNKFVQWNFTKDMGVLAAHQKLYTSLKYFGFRLDEDRLSIIEGTSDLYNVK